MRRGPLVLAVLAVLVLGGCGIPGDSGVRVLANGPSAGPAQGYDNATPPAPVSRTTVTSDYKEFVKNYLAAAAGDPESWYDRVTSFLTPEAKRQFKPSASTPTIQVVQPSQNPLNNPDEGKVLLYAREVGTLNKYGVLVPTNDASERTYTFQVVLHSDGLYLDSAPSTILLSEQALEQYYQRHTIYFWNFDNNGLVPDVRWMPLDVKVAQRPTVILNWLVNGPADWLFDVAQKPPIETPPENIPAATDDKLQITLNPQPQFAGDPTAIDRIRRQLQWSLRPDVPGTLELKIAHQNPMVFANQQYLESNAAFRLTDLPDRFVVSNGVIRRLADSAHPTEPVPLIKPDANRNVVSAALSASTDHTFAAVVTAAGKGATPTLRVAAAPTGRQADLRPVAGLAAQLGHPTWAIGASGEAATAVGLIISRGELYTFGTDGSAARQVVLPNNGLGAITSVSVAPDGRRLVLVAGGRLYRGELNTGSDGVTIPALTPILLAGLTSVSAVAWSSEGWLTVAGVSNARRTTIIDVTIDGAQILQLGGLADIGSDPVTYLTVYPESPLSGKTVSSAVAYEAGGKVWNAAGYPAKILPSELVGAPATTPPNAPVPTAPFFLQ